MFDHAYQNYMVSDLNNQDCNNFVFVFLSLYLNLIQDNFAAHLGDPRNTLKKRKTCYNSSYSVSVGQTLCFLYIFIVIMSHYVGNQQIWNNNFTDVLVDFFSPNKYLIWL